MKNKKSSISGVMIVVKPIYKMKSLGNIGSQVKVIKLRNKLGNELEGVITLKQEVGCVLQLTVAKGTRGVLNINISIPQSNRSFETIVNSNPGTRGIPN